jgi:uncharacterized membrane protein (DUF373 family)
MERHDASSGAGLESHESARAEAVFRSGEAAIYLVAGALLLVAAAFTVIGTVSNVVDNSDSRSMARTGVFMLDRVLLLFIVAELLYTLRLVNLGGRILVEPFLFIGLIAVVRRILIATAEFEGSGGRREVTDFVIQVGALAGLVVVLALSIHLLRRSALDQP